MSGNLTRVFGGMYSVIQAKQFVDQLMEIGGVTFVVEEGSEQTLLDAIGVVGYSVLESAVPGTVIGALLGMLFGKPHVGALVGGVLGGGIGVARGVHRLNTGYRVRAVTDVNGHPHFTFMTGVAT